MDTPYISRLLADATWYQAGIEDLLERYQVVPVGNGYIDLIVMREKAVQLVRDLIHLPVGVSHVTWWCWAPADERDRLGCPHGGGGPRHPFGDYYFGECTQHPWFSVAEQGVNLNANSADPKELAVECAALVCDFVERGVTREPYFTECLQPGLWLHVPDEWRRKLYFA